MVVARHSGRHLMYTYIHYPSRRSWRILKGDSDRPCIARLTWDKYAHKPCDPCHRCSSSSRTLDPDHQCNSRSIFTILSFWPENLSTALMIPDDIVSGFEGEFSDCRIRPSSAPPLGLGGIANPDVKTGR